MNTQILSVSIMVLIFSCILITQGAKPKIFAEFTQFKCVSRWPDLLQIHCHINLTEKNVSALYANFTLSEDMTNLNGSYKVEIERNHKFIDYTTFKVDYCSALQLSHSHELIQIIFSGFRRVSNFPLSCPVKKNKTYFVNGYIIDPKIIPIYMPELSFRTNATIASNNREIFYMTSVGRVVRK